MGDVERVARPRRPHELEARGPAHDRPIVERPRDPETGPRTYHLPSVVTDDEEGDADVARRVVARPGYDGDVRTGSVPLRLERPRLRRSLLSRRAGATASRYERDRDGNDG